PLRACSLSPPRGSLMRQPRPIPTSNSLVRTRYFSGELLTAENLSQEQTYFLDRFRRQNRILHGWGVVCGLDVAIVPTKPNPVTDQYQRFLAGVGRVPSEIDENDGTWIVV